MAAPQSDTGRQSSRALPCSPRQRCPRPPLLQRQHRPAPPSQRPSAPEPAASRLPSRLGPARLRGRWCPSARKPSSSSPRTRQLLTASACCAKAARGSAQRPPLALGLRLGRSLRTWRLRMGTKPRCSGRGPMNAPAQRTARQVWAQEPCQIASKSVSGLSATPEGFSSRARQLWASSQPSQQKTLSGQGGGF